MPSRPVSRVPCQTLRNVSGAWVQEQKVSVEDGKVVEFRVNMKVTFVLDD